MVDDFHGTEDWENFMNGMRQVLPDRPIEDLQSGDEIFHTLYDIDDKMQIPGEQYVWTGRTYEKDGYQPKWRAIRDDKGRIVVAICHNMHLGDAWEWADDPNYPEPFASMAFRVGTRLHHLRNDALSFAVESSIEKPNLTAKQDWKFACFSCFFKYPIPVFTKGRLRAAQCVACVAAARLYSDNHIWNCVFDSSPVARIREWPAHSGERLRSGPCNPLCWLSCFSAVAACHHRERTEFAAEHHCRCRGRLHSMGIADSDGKTREAAAIATLQDGILAGLKKRFQTRVYRWVVQLKRTNAP